MGVIDHLLNETATLKRRAASVSDGMGGQTGGGVTTVGTLKVRVSLVSDDEQERADQERGVLLSNIYAKPGADVKRGDVLNVRDTDFEVEVVSEPSEPNTYLRAQCKLTQASPV